MVYFDIQRILEGVQCGVDAGLPFHLVADVVFAPSGACIVGPAFAHLERGDGDGMPEVGACAHSPIREEATYIELKGIGCGIVRRVGILDKVVAKRHGRFVGRMEREAGTDGEGLVVAFAGGKVFVPHFDAIEVGALVERDDAMLLQAATFDEGVTEDEAHSEAQRTIVEYLVLLPGVGEADVAVGRQDGWCSASEGGTYDIAVVTHAVVDVERIVIDQLIGLGLVACTAELALRGLDVNVHAETARYDEFGRVLDPHVGAIADAAVALEGGPIDAIGTAIVLPGDVVETFGVEASFGPYLAHAPSASCCALGQGVVGAHPAGHATLHHVFCRPTGLHRCIDQQLAVGGDLEIDFAQLVTSVGLLPHYLAHDEGLALTCAEIMIDICHVHLDEFLALRRGRIPDDDVHLCHDRCEALGQKQIGEYDLFHFLLLFDY